MRLFAFLIVTLSLFLSVPEVSAFTHKRVVKDLKSLEGKRATKALKTLGIIYGKPIQRVTSRATWVVDTKNPDRCVEFTILFNPGGNVYGHRSALSDCIPAREAYEDQSL